MFIRSHTDLRDEHLVFVGHMQRPRFFPSCLGLMALVLGSMNAFALPDSTCPLQVEPPNPETAWHAKALATEKTLQERSSAAHDCRSIRIEVQPEGNALLTFTTTDGRIAVRLLHTADEILATVEALLVTLPVEKPLEKQAELPKPPIPGPLTVSPPKERAAPKPELVREPPRFVFQLFAGGRFGVDAGMFSPSFGTRALFLVRPWELGIGGEVDPLYVPLAGSAPSGFALRSFQGHFLVGRRFIQGPRVFRVGGTFGFGVVREEVDSDPVTKGTIHIDAFQPRVGLYGAVVVPRDKALRFVVGMHGDMAIWGVREAGTLKRNLPDLSRFGLGITLGMEIAP